MEGQLAARRPRILVIVPAFNEEESIDALLQRVASLSDSSATLDVLVVDDLSLIHISEPTRPY